MRRLNLFILSILLVTMMITFNRCDCDFFNDDDVISSKTGTVVGFVSELGQSGLVDVEVFSGNQTTYSINDGTFTLQNIPMGDRVSINFRINGFAPTSKIARVIENDTTYIQASMSKWGLSTSINSSQNNNVQFQNASVKLPPNSLVDESGNAVSGNVDVKASYFDPTDSLYHEVFPGDFNGENTSGNTVPIESFGFINVEITQGGKDLDLAPGQESEITIPLPSSIVSSAPSTIPLWYYDDEVGIWVEEGSASKQNGAYVGTVKHFSYWNADMEMQTSIIKGRVFCDDGITPVPFPWARVTVIGLDYSSTNSTFTDFSGWYELEVKSDSKVKVRAQRFADWEVVSYSQWEYVNTAPAQDMIIVKDLLLDCSDAFSFIYDIYSEETHDAWVVGDNGTILEIYDCVPMLWNVQPSGTDQALYAIDCPSYDNFWAVGSQGTVLHSTDMSKSWSLKGIGTVADLYDVEFHDGYYGWIVGELGVMYRTLDRGQTWTNLTSGTVQTLTSCSFVSPLEGWVCGTVMGTNGVILHTVDGGTTWTFQNSHIPENLNSIAFIDKDSGWAVGENGTITQTQDGGQNWTPQNSGTLEDLKGIDVYKIKNGGGFIVGNNGIGLYSKDGGQTWKQDEYLDIPGNINIEAVDISHDGIAWVGGENRFYWRHMGRPTATPGWTKQNSPASDTLWCVKAVSGSEAWVVGNNGITLHTDNSGNSWNDKSLSNNNLYVVEHVGSKTWIGGKDEFWISSDNGNTWTANSFIPPGHSMIKLQFTDSNNGWTFISNSGPDEYYSSCVKTLYKTTDGGLNWSIVSSLPLDPTFSYDDFRFIDSQTGWITNIKDVSNSNVLTLYSTNDGGSNWAVEDFPISSDIVQSKVYTIDGSLIWLYDSHSRKHVKESGKLWNSSNSGMGVLRHLQFTDENKGMSIRKQWGYLFYTRNGGETWNECGDQNQTDMEEIMHFDMYDDQFGWAVDNSGNIFFTNTGGE